MKARLPLLILLSAGLASCGTTKTTEEGTLATLAEAEPDLSDVELADGLERAAES